jgi:predicted metal-dependent HD superfamily phosphohydrolase
MELITIENLVKEYVKSLFEESTADYLVYHNFSHTEKVVTRSMEIAMYYKLDERAYFIISVAAWFHDTGHLFTEMEMHEEAGVHIMRTFLDKQNISEDLIESIASCILATKQPANPSRLMEGILCDADTWHFGTREFEITDVLVKKEMQLRTGERFDNWNQLTLKLLKHHRFFTSYCRNKLSDGKKINIESLQHKIKSSFPTDF